MSTPNETTTVNVALTHQQITHIRVALLLRIHKWAEGDGHIYDDAKHQLVPYKEHPYYQLHLDMMALLFSARHPEMPQTAADELVQMQINALHMAIKGKDIK